MFSKSHAPCYSNHLLHSCQHPLSALLSWFSSYLHQDQSLLVDRALMTLPLWNGYSYSAHRNLRHFSDPLHSPEFAGSMRVTSQPLASLCFLCCIFPVSHPFHSLSFTDAPVPFYPHEHLCTFTLPKYASIKNNCLVCPLDFQPWGPFATVGTLRFWIFGTKWGKIAGLLSTSSLCLALGTRVGEL